METASQIKHVHFQRDTKECLNGEWTGEMELAKENEVKDKSATMMTLEVKQTQMCSFEKAPTKTLLDEEGITHIVLCHWVLSPMAG